MTGAKHGCERLFAPRWVEGGVGERPDPPPPRHAQRGFNPLVLGQGPRLAAVLVVDARGIERLAHSPRAIAAAGKRTRFRHGKGCIVEIAKARQPFGERGRVGRFGRVPPTLPELALQIAGELRPRSGETSDVSQRQLVERRRVERWARSVTGSGRHGAMFVPHCLPIHHPGPCLTPTTAQAAA